MFSCIVCLNYECRDSIVQHLSHIVSTGIAFENFACHSALGGVVSLFWYGRMYYVDSVISMRDRFLRRAVFSEMIALHSVYSLRGRRCLH